MPVVRRNFVRGTVGGLLTAGATSLTSDALPDLPLIAAPDYSWLTLDPYEEFGPPEVVKVTAHAAGAATATIVRGQQTAEGAGGARSHSVGTVVEQALTTSELADLDEGVAAASDVADDLADHEALDVHDGLFAGPVSVGAPPTAGWPAAGGSLWLTGNLSLGNLATALPAGFGKTRGLNVQNGVAALAGDVEDAHGALILGSMNSRGAGAPGQVFGAEIQGQTLNVAGIAPDQVIGVNAIGLHQSNGSMPNPGAIIGLNGIAQLGNPDTPALVAVVDMAIGVRADAVDFVTPGHTLQNAVGFYARLQTEGVTKLSIYSEGDMSMALGARFGVGYNLNRPPSALGVCLNTATNGILNNGKSGLTVQQKGVSTDEWLSFYDASEFLIGGVGALNINHGVGGGDIGVIVRNYSWTNPALAVRSTGSVVVGTNGALATTATVGFLYVPTCAGTPTGVPVAETGTVPLVFDVTNDELYVYRGSWKSTAVFA